jgi:hypothetical protein
MFHFPAFPPHALYIQARVTTLTDGRVSPFGHPRITARLAAPRGLSRPTTSFIGSWCQGIHRAPLKTWPQRCSHPLFRSQTPTSTTQHPEPPASREDCGMDSARRSGTEDHNPRLANQERDGCSFRTQQCAEPEQAQTPQGIRADHVFDVPPMSAGMTTIGPSTGLLCALRHAARRPALV